jgi:hypothetical protein
VGKQIAGSKAVFSNGGVAMRKRLVSFLTLLAFILSLQVGCSSLRVGFSPPDWPQPPTPQWPDEDALDADFTIFFAIAGGVLLAGVVALLLNSKPVLSVLSAEGKSVQLWVHREAPPEAEFLADIVVEEGDQNRVKISLRNKAAKLGGNLLILDAITSTVHNGNTIGYSGSGRVYRMPD